MNQTPTSAPESGIWRRNLEGWARALFEGIDDAVFVHDLRGRILDVNPAACRRLGYTREELLRMKTSDIDDPEFAAGFNERLEQQMTAGTLRCEGKHRSKDGRTILVDINTSAIEFNGRPCILAVMRDITEQKKFERALRESEAFYHSLVESLPQNLFRKDREGRLTFANQRYCQLIKKPLRDLIGKNDFELFPEPLARKYREDDEKVVTSKAPLEVVEEHRLPSGRIIYVQVIKTPIFDENGEVIGIQGLFWDVTEKKRAQEAIAESERRYRQLTEATLDAIVVTDDGGRITLFNPAAEKLFGYQAKEVVGQLFELLIPDVDAPSPKGNPGASAPGGARRFIDHWVPQLVGRTVELSGRRKDGSSFPLELALSAIELTDPARPGQPARRHFLGAIRDLTERNRIRLALVQNEKLASIGLLSAGVAHEINNPLAFVSNNLAVLQRDLDGLLKLVHLYESNRSQLARADRAAAERIAALAEEIELGYILNNLPHLIAKTREGVERVNRIVQSLRSLARTGKPQRQLVALPDLVDSALEMVCNKIKRLAVQVETSYDPNPTLLCVASQIAQVLLNLIVNSLQAMEATGRTEGHRLSIQVRRLEGNPQEMEIRVSDTGCGIPAENLPRLFDPFFTTKEVGEGTGLGLSISHNIVTGHGGRIEVESTPGAGATFRVLLPLNPL